MRYIIHNLIIGEFPKQYIIFDDEEDKVLFKTDDLTTAYSIVDLLNKQDDLIKNLKRKMARHYE
jgi:hypothetical protein